MAGLMMLMSMPAHAVWEMYEDYWVEFVQMTNASATGQTIVKSVNNLEKSVKDVNSTLDDLFVKLGKQINGEFERLAAIKKSIAQVSVDSKLQHTFKRDVVAIKMKTTDSGNACEAVRDSIQIASVDSRTDRAKSEFMSKLLEDIKYTKSTAAKSTSRYAKHNAKFCSVEDTARGRDCIPGSDEMQNGDINPRSLYEPDGGNSQTYTDDEEVAAMAFVDNVINPYPAAMLPHNLEDTAEGRAYNDALSVFTARQMLAANSMLNSVAIRKKTYKGTVE